MESKFERKLKTVNQFPSYMQEALIEVNDTLGFAWATAQDVFGDAATSADALAICKLILERQASLLQEANRQLQHT